MNRASLEAMARQWRRHRALRHVGMAIAAACVATGVLYPFHAVGAVVVGFAVAMIAAIGLHRRSPSITASTLAEHLNRQCPALEESAALWLREPGSLDIVERLQLGRLNQAWSQQPTPPPGLPPSGRLLPNLVALIAAAVFLGAVIINTAPPGAQPPGPSTASRDAAAAGSPVLSAVLEVHPPAYLGRPSRRIDTLSAEIEEGAEVIWSFVTAPDVTGLELSGHGLDAALVAQLPGDGRFQIRRLMQDTFVYQVSVWASGGSKTTLPALHALEVRRDTPPRLTWRTPALARTILASDTNIPPLAVEILAADDHAVDEVRLLLTVAKGAGEGTRFREQSEILQAMSTPGSSNLLYGKTIDLEVLGLEPGDELYLQAVALDSRRPIPNESRTESRCIVLTGPGTTASDPAVVLSGVRRIPQYFRSQRQLILDTEQLLAERATLSDAQFRTRSENLGIDQKLLRLRYGQFLGEEFETSSAGAPREATAMEWAAALRNPSGQDADRTAAIGRAIEATHAHEPGSAQDLFAEITHNHDSPEAATFFDERLKASLRAVLAAMWQAEGFLRIAQPADALPSEKRALEILKAIQQTDRISVSRVGSELPPLRLDERRLRGELETIPASAPGTATTLRRDPDSSALRQAVAFLAGNATERMPQELATRVEDLLWRAAQARPERYLPALEQWRARATALSSSSLDTIRQAVWSLLPATEETPHRRRSQQPGLEHRYADAVDALTSAQP